ncbi:MAG: TolC family protein, partial [Bacteroidota bacterium]|nr:TolC family protein [Bacteroidota bacterium]
LNTERSIQASQLILLLDFEPREKTVDGVYEAALRHLASVKAKELREEAAAKGVAVARAQYTPQISLFANFGTNYSSAARLFQDAGTQTVQTGDFVTVTGTDYAVFTQEGLFDALPISYTDQFNNNLNSAAGVSVNIPIFNGFQAKNAVQLQKVNRDQASVVLEQTKRALKQNISKTYADLQAASKNYHFLEDQVRAYEESFRINEVKFNLGVSTSVAYITSKNNLDNARINLTNARYAYLLTSRVLDYYSGVIPF